MLARPPALSAPDRWSYSAASQALALKLLIHLVGDMHQPLHLCGRDRGGNDITVQFGEHEPVKLHAIWDGYLVQLTMREAEERASERGE